MFLENKVKIPTPTLKLHWPDRWSPCCQTEVEVIAGGLYQCVSCHRISAGRTEYIEGKVTWINQSQTQ